MPLVSLHDLEKSLKLNFLIENSASLNLSNNLNLLLGANGAVNCSSIISNALLHQIQAQSLSKLANNANLNSLLLSNIKANLANQFTGNCSGGGPMSSPNGGGNKQQQQQTNHNRYKTELCRQYSENGECKYGEKCQFAHGLVDLKDVNRHPKYKTDFCKTFHSKGFCPYGPRCHFIHETYEKSELINGNGKHSVTPRHHPNGTTTYYDAQEQNKSRTPLTKAGSSATFQTEQQCHEHPSQLDKQLEAMQAQLAQSLFSSLTDDAPSGTELGKMLTTVTTESVMAAAAKPAESATKSDEQCVQQLNRPLTLDELNHSFASPSFSGPMSPVILSASSSASSASVSSATSPNSSMFKLSRVVYQQKQKHSGASLLAKQPLEFKATAVDLISPQSSTPSSPAPRTRSSISSTSSSTSSCSMSNASSSSSSNWLDSSNRNSNGNILEALVLGVTATTKSPVELSPRHALFVDSTTSSLSALHFDGEDQTIDNAVIGFGRKLSDGLEFHAQASANKCLGAIGQPMRSKEVWRN